MVRRVELMEERLQKHLKGCLEVWQENQWALQRISCHSLELWYQVPGSMPRGPFSG